MPEPNTAPAPQSQPPVTPKRRFLFGTLAVVFGMVLVGIIGGAVGYALDDSAAPIPSWGFPFNPYGLKAGLGAWAGITLGGIAGGIIVALAKRNSR